MIMIPFGYLFCSFILPYFVWFLNTALVEKGRSRTTAG